MAVLQLGSSRFTSRVLRASVCAFAFIGVLPALSQTIGSHTVKQTFTPSTDLSLGVFGQLTPSRIPVATSVFSSGTGVTQTTQGTSPSAGVLGTFHQSVRPWLGYNVNIGYSRFSENYSEGWAVLPNKTSINPPNYSFAQGSIGTNMYELTVAYAVQGPKTKHFTTFAQLGGGGLFFLPTKDPAPYSEQIRTTMVFGVGMNYKLSEHLGLRAEYRGLFYKNPDFKGFDSPIPVSKLFTVTSEPTIGIVYTFGHGKQKSLGRMY